MSSYSRHTSNAQWVLAFSIAALHCFAWLLDQVCRVIHIQLTCLPDFAVCLELSRQAGGLFIYPLHQLLAQVFLTTPSLHMSKSSSAFKSELRCLILQELFSSFCFSPHTWQ